MLERISIVTKEGIVLYKRYYTDERNQDDLEEYFVITLDKSTTEAQQEVKTVQMEGKKITYCSTGEGKLILMVITSCIDKDDLIRKLINEISPKIDEIISKESIIPNFEHYPKTFKELFEEMFKTIEINLDQF